MGIGAAFLCALPVQGQAIPEGYPVKPVHPGESAEAPVLHDECDPLQASDAFAEVCTGVSDGDTGPAGVIIELPGEGESIVLDPAWHTPPRVECPSAVFLEELETSAIDCHVYDAVGEGNLDYFWEPVGGATRDYLENPRLLPEDAPNPVVVAPSFPVYDTLESFLSEEGAQRYRYRLTVTSRATGLSSYAEVEVFVRSSQPGVYCPLELEVEEGDTVVLACEGADPLSFRMDASDERGGGSLALWAWEGLWGSSTSPLAATDTPQPVFTAPAGSAGRTYHYVASLTTSSSGVPRTARRRVSVTVKAGEGVAAFAAPSITCPGSPYEVFEGSGELTLKCEAEDAPEGATYVWAYNPPELLSLLSDQDTLVTTFRVPDEIQDYFSYSVPFGFFHYTISMQDSLANEVAGADADVYIKVKNKPNITLCNLNSTGYSVDEGGEQQRLNRCVNTPGGAPGDTLDTPYPYTYRWETISPTPSSALAHLDETDVYHPVFTSPEVDKTTVFHYKLVVSAENADDAAYPMDVTVRNLNAGQFSLACIRLKFTVYDNVDSITLECNAPAAPANAVWKWEARAPTPNTDLLSATDIRNPEFEVPLIAWRRNQNEKFFYYTVSVKDTVNAAIQEEDVLVKVNKRTLIVISCEAGSLFYEDDAPRTIGNCTFTRGSGTVDPALFTTSWKGVSTTDERYTTAQDLLDGTLSSTTVLSPVFTPHAVDRHETYRYSLEFTWYPDGGVFHSPQPVYVLDYGSLAAVLELDCTGTITFYETGGPVRNHLLSCMARPALPPAGTTYEYIWEADNGLDLAQLIDGRRTPTATFRVPPDVDGDQTYTYRATVSAPNTKPASDIVTVTILDTPDILVTCTEDPYETYAEEEIMLDCEAENAPPSAVYTYAWEERGGTLNTDHLVAGADGPTPTFRADQAGTYEYLLRVTAPNANEGTVDVTVNVLSRPQITATCTGTPYEAYEGSEDDIPLDCSASGAPGTAPVYTYAWKERGATPRNLLSATNIGNPTFAVPEDVQGTTKYEYALTVTAPNAVAHTLNVTVTVLERPDIAVVCTGTPYEAYEGSEDDISLDCSASGAPGTAPAYTYSWKEQGATPANLLSATNTGDPTFRVPEDVERTTQYEYVLTATADNADMGTLDVTVTVLERPDIVVTCTDNPYSAYEGADPIALDCAAMNAPGGNPDYTYAWTPLNNTGDPSDVSLLSALDIPNPTFAVPEDVPKTTKYEYVLTATADDADAGMVDVTVTVLNEGAISLACADPEVYEGSPDLTLRCTVSGGAGDNPEYTFAWTPAGSTPDVNLLSADNLQNPVFAVPNSVSQDETYEYRVTASSPNAEAGVDDVTVTVLNKPDIEVACTGNPYSAYEGTGDIALNCAASGAPAGSVYEYAWTAQGATLDTGLLSASAVASPTFRTPASVEADETYEYVLTVTAPHAEPGRADVAVTVLNNLPLALACTDPDPVYEGSGDIPLLCEASGAPAGSEYDYVWAPRNATPDVGLLSAPDMNNPTFYVPADVSQTTRYEYRVTARAAHADAASADVTVTVLNTGAIAVVCRGNPYSAYEGSPDITLDCEASGDAGGPAVSAYTYAWEARGGTLNTDLLVAGADGPSPTFAVPVEVGADETYEYRLTVSAENAEAGTAEVTVTVLNKAALALVCANPAPVYEGSPDIALECAASGGPGGSGALAGSEYEYVWTLLNNTGAMADTDLLSRADIASPTFFVPEDVPQTTRYEYQVTVSAEHADPAMAEVTVTVLNKGALALVCAGNPYSAYEGSEDIPLDCEAMGAPDGSEYEYAWTGRGATADTELLSAADIASPTFAVPAAVDANETYDYLLTVSAENAEAATMEVTVTVLNKGALALVCTGNPYSAYEGSEDIALDCSASGAPGAPDGSVYEYTWTVRGATADTDRLSAVNVASPTFAVPAEVDADETYEYLLTVSAENAEAATVEVTVTVLNKGALALVCAGNPYSAYEGSEDITLDCAASGAPEGSEYAYAWTVRGATVDTDLLSAADVASPTFAVPDSVDADETYEYLLTVSADRSDDATVDVTVTVLNRVPPAPEPVASSGDPSALGVRVSVSPLRFGVQSSDAKVSLDPLSEQISTSVSGPHHAGRMTLSLDEAEELALFVELVTPVTLRRRGDEMVYEMVERSADIATDLVTDKTAHEISDSAANNETTRRTGIAANEIFGTSLDKKSDTEMDIEAGKMMENKEGNDWTQQREISDIMMDTAMDKTAREISDEAWDKVTGAPAFLSLSPRWSVAESCESLSSQTIGGWHTEARLSESDCRLLLFGGELDLSGAIPGRYAGTMNLILRTDSGEETHSIEVEVEVAPTQYAMLAGAEGVRFAGPDEGTLRLTEAQNVRISPNTAYLTRAAPSGAFALTNMSLIPLELSVSARFGYTEASEAGFERVVEDLSVSPLGDLSALVDIYPKTLILPPGEEGVIRYGVREEVLALMGAPGEEGLMRHGVRADTLASMGAPGEEGLGRYGVREDTLASLMASGYAAFFEITSAPHQYVRTDQLPQAATTGKTAHVTMRIPGAYAPDEAAPSLRAELISVSEGASPSATFLVETERAPFFGEMVAYDGDGRELGRRQTLVYTRSRVRMPLTRTPEGETVFLRFISSGGSSGRSSGRSSGPSRISEPVSVPWDAPQRDSRIGATPTPGQTPEAAALARKP